MPNKDNSRKIYKFRISISDDLTGKEVWGTVLKRNQIFISIISIVFVLLVGNFALFGLTPIRTFIPGYPDARTKHKAIENAILIDSLENVILKWEFYSENLRRIVEGEEPLKIDSLIKRNTAGDTLHLSRIDGTSSKDSLLRNSVKEAEQFHLKEKTNRNLTIEGMHFFIPLKGVVSQGFDEAMHPYIDITAPKNSVVMSVLDGTVINAGWSDENGYTIQIQHANNIVSIYKHNEKLMKKIGDKVTAGSPIAIIGNSGTLTTGEHLHFELWYKGEAVDPTKYINF